jgi:hypothetical protein
MHAHSLGRSETRMLFCMEDQKFVLALQALEYINSILLSLLVDDQFGFLCRWCVPCTFFFFFFQFYEIPISIKFEIYFIAAYIESTSN